MALMRIFEDSVIFWHALSKYTDQENMLAGQSSSFSEWYFSKA